MPSLRLLRLNCKPMLPTRLSELLSLSMDFSAIRLSDCKRATEKITVSGRFHGDFVQGQQHKVIFLQSILWSNSLERVKIKVKKSVRPISSNGVCPGFYSAFWALVAQRRRAKQSEDTNHRLSQVQQVDIEV